MEETAANTKEKKRNPKSLEHRLNIRMSAAEYMALEEYIKQNDYFGVRTKKKVNISKALRKLISKVVDDKVVPTPKRPSISSQELTGMKEELRCIGVNLNQLTRSLNALIKRDEVLYNATRKRTIESVDYFIQHVNDLIDRIKKFG